MRHKIPTLIVMSFFWCTAANAAIPNPATPNKPRGLKNPSGTHCYFNATIQCLLQVPEFNQLMREKADALSSTETYGANKALTDMNALFTKTVEKAKNEYVATNKTLSIIQAAKAEVMRLETELRMIEQQLVEANAQKGLIEKTLKSPAKKTTKATSKTRAAIDKELAALRERAQELDEEISVLQAQAGSLKEIIQTKPLRATLEEKIKNETLLRGEKINVFNKAKKDFNIEAKSKLDPHLSVLFAQGYAFVLDQTKEIDSMPYDPEQFFHAVALGLFRNLIDNPFSEDYLRDHLGQQDAAEFLGEFFSRLFFLTIEGQLVRQKIPLFGFDTKEQLLHPDTHDILSIAPGDTSSILALSIPDQNAFPSLKDCFDSNFTKETFVEDFDRKDYGGGFGIIKKTKFNKDDLPHYLILQLKRFSFEGGMAKKIHTPVSFEIDGLDLAPYCDEQPSDDNRFYHLIGIVQQSGTLSSGHYTAYVRHGPQWYFCNDDRITPVKQAFMNAFAARGIPDDFFVPYLLFYKKGEPPAGTSEGEDIPERTYGGYAAFLNPEKTHCIITSKESCAKQQPLEDFFDLIKNKDMTEMVRSDGTKMTVIRSPEALIPKIAAMPHASLDFEKFDYIQYPQEPADRWDAVTSMQIGTKLRRRDAEQGKLSIEFDKDKKVNEKRTGSAFLKELATMK